MSYIEGIGDELLAVIAIFLLLLLVVLVWLSTSVIEPRVSIFVVGGDTFQELMTRVQTVGVRIINLNRTLTASPEADDSVSGAPDNQESVGDVVICEELNAPSNSQELNAPSNSEELNDPSNSHSTVEQEAGEDKVINESENVTIKSDAAKTPDQSSSGEPDAARTPDQSSSGGSDQFELVKGVSKESFVEEVNDMGLAAVSSEEEPVCDTAVSGDSEASKQPEAGESSTEITTTQDGPQQSTHGDIRIKLKYLDDRQRTVQVPPYQTLGEFKRNHFAEELAENLMVRLIYNGQELRQDTKPLQAYNIQDRCVIHCLLSENNQHNPLANQPLLEDDQFFNVGCYVFPLFGLILGLIWYSRFTYARFFNAFSTLCLVGISFMYTIALIVKFRPRGEQEFHEHDD